MMVRDGPFIDGKSVQNGDLPSKNGDFMVIYLVKMVIS